MQCNSSTINLYTNVDREFGNGQQSNSQEVNSH